MVFGMFMLIVAAIYTSVGRAYVRFNGRVTRTEDPRSYWGEVAAYYLVGAVSFACYLVRL